MTTATKKSATDYKVDIKNSITRLGKQLSEGKSESLKIYLKSMAQFHQYSFSNVMLIMLQNPDAKQVAGYKTWQKLKRNVRSGEKGLKILAPGFSKSKDKSIGEESDKIYFRCVSVFDISQTTGESLPEPSNSTGDATEFIPKIENVIKERGISLEYKDYDADYYGDSNAKEKRITINNSLSSAETFRTLAHELAHSILHPGKGDKAIRELESDAVSCVVSEFYGLKNSIESASDYIQLWGGNIKQFNERMSTIQKTSDIIIKAMEEKLND